MRRGGGGGGERKRVALFLSHDEERRKEEEQRDSTAQLRRSQDFGRTLSQEKSNPSRFLRGRTGGWRRGHKASRHDEKRRSRMRNNEKSRSKERRQGEGNSLKREVTEEKDQM